MIMRKEHATATAEPTLRPGERIAPIANYSGAYSVTTEGRVWSHRNGRFLKLTKASTGYLVVSLSVNGTREVPLVHRLVARAFLVNTNSSRDCVNHISGDKTDNRLKNLEIVTQDENLRHSREVLGNHHGPQFGESHHFAKISDRDAAEIVSLKGVVFQRDLAKRFGVTQGHISAIQSGARRPTTIRACACD